MSKRFPLEHSFELASMVRLETLRMTNRAGSSHIASCLSVADILAVFYSGCLNISPENVADPERDVVILSKGHAAAALYATLAHRGFFPPKNLETYCFNNSTIGGHVTSGEINGVELSTGSLGHGLPYGLGIALSKKLSRKKGKVVVVMSDGECDEGTTWESAMIANHNEISNVVVVIDRNMIQSLGSTEETLKLEPFEEKWKAFGWKVRTIDGHSHLELFQALENVEGPLCIIANTTKGKGVPFMENSVLWHYKFPSDVEVAQGISYVRGIYER